MTYDPASPGGEQQPGQPGWSGQQPYPGGYGQQPPSSWTPPGPTQQYPAGPGGPGPAPASSFLGALFDFGFNTFATPVVIKVLYVLGLIGIALGYVIAVIAGFSQDVLTGLAFLVGGGLVALFYLILFRVFLEFYYAVVRMSEDIHRRGG
jgi:hypothetical protein